MSCNIQCKYISLSVLTFSSPKAPYIFIDIKSKFIDQIHSTQDEYFAMKNFFVATSTVQKVLQVWNNNKQHTINISKSNK